VLCLPVIRIFFLYFNLSKCSATAILETLIKTYDTASLWAFELFGFKRKNKSPKENVIIMKDYKRTKHMYVYLEHEDIITSDMYEKVGLLKHCGKLMCTYLYDVIYYLQTKLANTFGGNIL
jgi:hypothetical protein